MAELIFVGDVMHGRKVNRAKDVFEEVKNTLKNADIVFGNLESPLCNGLEFVKNKKYVFSADKRWAVILKSAGFKVLSLANNHIIDCGEDGIRNTTKLLKENGISFVGLNEANANNANEKERRGMGERQRQNPLVIEKEGIRIGFLAYCKKKKLFDRFRTRPYVIDENIFEDVKEAKKKADVLVVSLHWGKEYENQPSEEQEETAKKLVDNGADVIVGHHSHVVQNVERYKNRIIAYSLGNFVFDQLWSEKTRRGVMLRVDIYKKGIKKFEEIGTYIDDNFKIRLMDEPE